MSARNDASIRLTLMADAAISKASQLKTGMQQIGTEAQGAGTKTGTATKTMSAGLGTVSASAKTTASNLMGIGTTGTVMGNKVSASTKLMTTGLMTTTGSARVLGTSFNNVGTQATVMGQKTVAATNQMAAGTAKAGAGAVAGGGSMMMMGAATAGLSASVVQLQTSFSSLTAYEIKHDKAQLKVKKNMDTLNATKIMAMQYNARLEDMAQKGITSGTTFNYVQAMSIQYNTMLKTKTEDLVLVKRKAVLASEELSDANANFWSGVITSSINIAIMTSLLVTNIIAMKGQGLAAITSSKAITVLTLGMRGLGAAMWTVAKHPVFLIATAAFLAWELALSGVVEKMMGLEDGSLSVTKNVMKLFDSMGQTAYATNELADESSNAALAQVDLGVAIGDTSIIADGAAGNMEALTDSVIVQTKHNDKLTVSLRKTNKELVEFKKKRQFNYSLLGKKYTGVAAGSMSEHGNLYQTGTAMGNKYYSSGSSGWSAQDQVNKEARMAANLTASKARNKKQNDIKDGIVNMMRDAGLGWGAMNLTDGSRIKTLRGHYTNRHSKDEQSRGFKGGEELQGSYLQGGASAWKGFSGSVGSITSRMSRGGYAGDDAVKSLQRLRAQYGENIKSLVKEMVAAQLKETEEMKAEATRLAELDGTKAKEYFNKVGTHDAYDVYDRINYRSYKTNMEGGATANI